MTPSPLNELRMSLNYGSTMSLRFFLALAALMQSAGYVFGASAWSGHPLHSAAVEIFPVVVWGIAYGVVGALGMWRVLDPRSHPRCAWFVNTLTCFVWMTGLVARARIGPETLLSTYSVVALISVVCLLRTEATHRDTRLA